MSRIRVLYVVAAVAIVIGALPPTVAADVYYFQPVSSLKIVEGQLPTANDPNTFDYRRWGRRRFMQPYGVIDGEGEIFLQPYSSEALARTDDNAFIPAVAIRTSAPREVTGKLFLPQRNFSGMTAVKFVIPADQGKEDLRNSFLETKLAHYQSLFGRDLPGAAWFRRQVRETNKHLGRPPMDVRGPVQAGFNVRGDSFENTYDLISGGRAISENLQLDRALPESEVQETTVPVDSIQGITVREFDWKPLIKDAKPQRDPLAALVPDDQYALLVPSFQAFIELADHIGEDGADVLRAASPRSEDALVRQRYERQLGLSLNQAARVIGPAMVDGVALTGADPYLRTGADLAILFQAKDPAALRTLISAQVQASVADSGAQPVRGEIQGVPYAGFRSADRAICSYVASLGSVVVVTNSPVQLEQIVKVFKGERPSLDALDEYTFFRTRYPREDGAAADPSPSAFGETGLLILSDKTIRKWCGPRWRIASSRRTRAAALLADLQAAHLDGLVAGKIAAGPLHTDLSLPDAGDFTLAPAGVQSSVYGTLEFLTPIIELDVDKVTPRERELYDRWRQGYERNWSTFFDPIAVRFHASADKLAADLTVMPLIDFSDYRRFVSVSRGAKIGPDSGDPHPGSLFHGVLALNIKSDTVRQGAGMARNFINVDPLSWIGQSVSVYLDNDPLWAELASQPDDEKREEFMEDNAHRIPVALNVEVANGIKLVAFLAAARTFIEQAAPGMTVWETLAYRDQAYVKISLAESARRGNSWDKLALYYAPGEALVVTLSEDLLKRALDRRLARQEQKKSSKQSSEPRGSSPRSVPTWLGENLAVAIDGKFLQLLQTAYANVYQQQMQLASWGNLPILNEWRSRFPDQDPVALHERFWQRKLVGPGGDEYRWNDHWHTMESTLFGHPGEPKEGGALPALLRTVNAANFGQTFEPDGLRARVQLSRQSHPNAGN